MEKQVLGGIMVLGGCLGLGEAGKVCRLIVRESVCVCVTICVTCECVCDTMHIEYCVNA